jgi:hypothetical protein
MAYVFLIIVLIAVGFLIFKLHATGRAVQYADSIPAKTAGSSNYAAALNYNNMISYLSGIQLVKDIPEGATLSLRFFNFNSGERQWENSYILTRGSAREGLADNADIYLTIHSKYLGQFTGNNFCAVIKRANANRDLGFESPLSKAGIAWKFKSMYQYRECLGF